MSFTASPCFSGASVTGNVSGANLNGSLQAGGIQVNISATVSGVGNDMMNGTYHAVSAGACTGDTGTVTLTRTSPFTIDDQDGNGEPVVQLILVYDDMGNLIRRARRVMTRASK